MSNVREGVIKGHETKRKKLYRDNPELDEPFDFDQKPTELNESRNARLIQQLINEKFDPLHALIVLAKSDRTDPALKAKISTEILSYCLPKIKATEPTDLKKEDTLNIQVIFPDEDKSNEQSNDSVPTKVGLVVQSRPSGNQADNATAN